MVYLWLRQRATGSILLRASYRIGTATASRSHLLLLQQQSPKSFTTATPRARYDHWTRRRPIRRDASRSPRASHDGSAEPEQLSRRPSDPANTDTWPSAPPKPHRVRVRDDPLAQLARMSLSHRLSGPAKLATTPIETTPPETVPKKAIPKKAIPQNATPQKAAPVEAAPVKAIPTEAGSSGPKLLPGQMAKLLDLVDTHRKPLISYLPDEALFVRHAKKKLPIGLFEHRKTVNTDPNQLYKIRFYNKMRESLLSKLSVHHRRFRGALLANVQRLFSLHGATNEFHRPLGLKKLLKHGENDESRIVRGEFRDQVFDKEDTRATLELLPTGQAALLWIQMIPMRWISEYNSQKPSYETPLKHYKWASLVENRPWNALANVLELSPNRTLKAPSVSPSSPDYEVWPTEEACSNPPLPSKEVARRVLFMHVMPLFMEMYGKDGKRANKLWGGDRRNENLPVVFSWQEKYIWCIWRNGPHGPLEMQQTGDWIPEVLPGSRTYEAEQASIEALGLHDLKNPIKVKGTKKREKPSLE